MSVNYTQLDENELDFVTVADESEISSGERLMVEIDEFSLVIFNIAGKYFAIADLCSHDNGSVGEGEIGAEYEIACPRHGARFDIRSGKVLSPPAAKDIPAYPVRVVDGQVQVGLPKR
jgi:3-phenylpropionate/trans-cinnamate dioxygenase ferredoxin subunit